MVFLGLYANTSQRYRKNKILKRNDHLACYSMNVFTKYVIVNTGLKPNRKLSEQFRLVFWSQLQIVLLSLKYFKKAEITTSSVNHDQYI